jgi:protein-disulfide isomerase
MFLVALGFSVYSVILAIISTFIIHSYCIMCMVGYAINFLLLFYTWIIRNRFNSEPMFKGLKLDFEFLVDKRSYCYSVFTPFFLGLVLVKVFFPGYWNFEQPILSSQISSGITVDGHPWIGAERPELVITEYTDYQCFQCKKMHYFIRQLISRHPEKIRLVHRHFPMDHEFNPIVKEPFHIGSGKMALLAISAATKDRFWQMNDVLFDRAGETATLNVKALADQLGLAYQDLGRSINDPAIRMQLYRDIRDGLKLDIDGTPAFVVDEKVYLAQIPPEIIKNALKP